MTRLTPLIVVRMAPVLVQTRAASTTAFTSYTLVGKRPTGLNSSILTFAIPEGMSLSGPEVPSSVYASAVGLKKSYSPVSRSDDQGTFDLLVKPYPPREGGGLARHLCELAVGETASMQVKAARVMHGSTDVTRRWRHLAMVAGGTGIAPFIQILRHVLPDGDADEQVPAKASRRIALDRRTRLRHPTL